MSNALSSGGLSNVSCETLEKIDIYINTLLEWNQKINLVSKSEVLSLRERHIEDSAQIFSLLTGSVDHWLDLGSGGGFPGIVVAILDSEFGSISRMTLVESDIRKCVFLREVIRKTALNAVVLTERIEKLPPQNANVVSARALAPLDRLLFYSYPHMASNGILYFPKGENYKKELSAAYENWGFDLSTTQSTTNEKAVILSVSSVFKKATLKKDKK